MKQGSRNTREWTQTQIQKAELVQFKAINGKGKYEKKKRLMGRQAGTGHNHINSPKANKSKEAARKSKVQ